MGVNVGRNSLPSAGITCVSVRNGVRGRVRIKMNNDIWNKIKVCAEELDYDINSTLLDGLWNKLEAQLPEYFLRMILYKND